MNESGEAAGRPAGTHDGDQTDGMARQAMLARTFVRLADTLVSDFDIVEFLHGLSTDSVGILGAEAAGVMLTDGRGGLRLIASSEERMRLLELFELQGAEGPCLDAFSSGRSLQASAADSRVRWPVFAVHAAEVGFQRMCAVPLRVRADTIGALNVFRGSDEPFSEDEMQDSAGHGRSGGDRADPGTGAAGAQPAHRAAAGGPEQPGDHRAGQGNALGVPEL